MKTDLHPVAFRLSTTMPVRTVKARPRPEREAKDNSLPARLRALYARGIRDLDELASKAGCGRSTAWRHLKGKK